MKDDLTCVGLMQYLRVQRPGCSGSLLDDFSPGLGCYALVCNQGSEGAQNLFYIYYEDFVNYIIQ